MITVNVCVCVNVSTKKTYQNNEYIEYLLRYLRIKYVNTNSNMCIWQSKMSCKKTFSDCKEKTKTALSIYTRVGPDTFLAGYHAEYLCQISGKLLVIRLDNLILW